MKAKKPARKAKHLNPVTIQAIRDQVYEIAEIIVSANYFVVDVDLEEENGRWYLRIYLDHPNTQVRVTLEDCKDISQALGPMIDEAVKELSDFPYMLEVSSPGLFRKLTKPREFIFYKGRRIELKPKKQDAFIAYLHGYDADTQSLLYRLSADEADEPQSIVWRPADLEVSLCPDLTEKIELKTVPRRITRYD